MGYVLGFQEIDRTQVAVVGGKGANLGELSRIEGVRVPDGFCVTTAAFRQVVAGTPVIDELIGQLSRIDPEDRESIRVLSAAIREAIEASALPGDIAAEIAGSIAGLGSHHAYAVRSSATAEDLPNASFAGQQDTYLNIVGPAAVLRHIGRCWGSLFTERAVTYRLHNGFEHRKVQMAVVVQQMVFPEAAGILVTADPVTSNRKVVSVDAGFGLGEALVSGLVNADVYKVRDSVIIDRTVATKRVAVAPAPAGGTFVQEIEDQRQNQQVLTDAQIVDLADLGRGIEAHFGSPQDIEWCLADDEFRIVQSRPITTLFPIPEAADDANRVYVSVGHQQMMTDPMKPLGISIWQLTSRAPMRHAGGRLFIDVTERLASPTARRTMIEALGKSDPLIGDALRTVAERDDIVRTEPEAAAAAVPEAGAAPGPTEIDPAVVTELIADNQASVEALKRDIETRSGPELLDFIHTDIQEMQRLLFDPRSYRAIVASIDAAFWLDDHLGEWLGEKNNAADTLAQSVPHNVTSEMGLALLDVADVIRPYPEVVTFLRQVEEAGYEGRDFLDELVRVPGGREAQAAIESYLDRYGMRCAGEIDLTRPRWSERPAALVPTILGNIKSFEPGAAERRFEDGRREAGQKEADLLTRLRALPDGERKARETARMIEQLRTFSGYREYPKYGMVSRYFIYKQALLREAERLVRGRVLRRPDDIFYLTFDELARLVRTQQSCDQLISERREAFRTYRALTPPRVITSDGETFAGAYRRADLPAGALAGMAVSSGIVEGRARVVSDMARADLEPGDILVTAYTDPSWTPLFVAITGLITEVGGLMTHGAVIAREYGLPAVVGVEQATRLIRDGQRIRVNGTDGYIEVLSDE
ncbi:rifamycin-inactivating phosphotransferase [Nocardia sp. NPDC001965]